MENIEKIKKIDEIIASKFFVPKEDSQQEEFLQKYPEYDGRGIKIAIIDSGVDVSLDGLQKTSTGLPKIIDCFDFTGVGNVDTSKIRKTESILTLLSGREVKIPQSWKNPSNEWHLGIKDIRKIRSQMIDENEKENQKVDEHLLHEQKAAAVKKAWKIVDNKNFTAKVCKDNNVDFIVWHDGQRWQACIILPETKNLENAKVLTNFRDSHEYCFILDNVACCATIHKNGNLLELFLPHDEHGTLVAQVAAAHFSKQPEKDGLAPGAQIISMNINNATYQNMLMKSLNKCIEMEVDVVNLSRKLPGFSDPKIIKLLNNMVNEHRIIIIQAAGNFGPFLSSMRDDTFESNDEIITIGSLFTNGMKRIVEKENDDNPKFLWYYSSRGPLPNGARGITCVAPADAVVENPQWHSMKKIIFTGTSCAAPNAAGAIACLLSGLKANGMEYSPAMIKMALSNTAFLPDGGDRLEFGNGIIQINEAFEYLKTFKENFPRIVFPQLSIRSKEKGIVVYKTKNLSFINKYNIKVQGYSGNLRVNLCPKIAPYILSRKMKIFMVPGQRFSEGQFKQKAPVQGGCSSYLSSNKIFISHFLKIFILFQEIISKNLFFTLDQQIHQSS